MFDNLKKKLGSFRQDAEVAAEENVEEVEEADLDEAPDDGEAPAEADAEADAEPAVDAEAEPESSTETVPASDPEIPDTTAKSTPDADDTTSEIEADREDLAEATDDGPIGGGPTTDAVDASDAAVESASEPSVDADATPEKSDAAVDSDAASDTEPAPDVDDAPDSSIGAEAASESDGVSDADDSFESADADADAGVDEDPAADADADTDENTTTDEDTEGGATGFGAKARSLVKGKFVIEEEDLEGPLHELEMALLTSDVEMGVAEEILDNIREELIGETRTFTTSTGEVVEEALRDAIYDVISIGQFDFDERIAVEDKPVTLIFTGVNGVGKTTSIAKLSRYFEERGYSTVMANGDTYRAGANQQIQEHADALDTKCISHEQGGDPAAVLYDAVEYAEANDVDVVLGDTAGRLHTNEGLMDQLEKIERVVGPDLTLFVDEAVAGQDAVNRAREFNEAAAIDGSILTKADADSNGGAAISIAHVTGKPILFLGVGQGYDDLERFNPDEMVDRLLAEE
jgi:fused signal recognition particle receptor